MTAPKLSVLIPTYNYARYLPEAIASILEQDFRDFELIISDDCSTDNSASVIRAYAERDRRIRVQIHPANLGMVQNWNWCLAQAKGEYVKYVFGDDKLAGPQALSKLVALLDANPSATLAASARLLIDEDSKVIKIRDDFGRPGRHRGAEVIADCLGQNRNLIGEPSAVLLRRTAAARGFNARYNQLADQEMWFHLLAAGDFVYAPEPLCAFRSHRLQQTRINEASKVFQQEGRRLFLEYHDQPYLGRPGRRKRLFEQWYELRKNRRGNVGAPDQDMIEIGRLARQIGWHWYAFYWLQRRATKPFANLARRCKDSLRRS